MKTLKFLILGTISLFLFNCSNDDDGAREVTPPTIHEQIAYKWYLSKVETVGDVVHLLLTDCDKRTYYEFFSNGEANIEFFETQPDGSCESTFFVNGTYEILEIDGDTGVLISTEGGESEGSIIVSVSETELVLEQQGFGTRHLTFVKE